MRIYRKEVHGVKVEAYKDSGAQWVVQAGNDFPMRFDVRKFTMRDAMDFAAKLAAGVEL